MPISSWYSELSVFLNPWVIIGFFGQFVFFLRFIVQWIISEKKKAVVVPMAFWYLSVVGTLIILAYSIHIKDIVFTVAQILSLFIYWRNMVLQRRFAAQGPTSASESEMP